MAVTRHIEKDVDLLAFGPELGSTCGDNAMNWARVFCAIAKERDINLGDDPEGWMVGWFANAIECAQDARNRYGCVDLPDLSAPEVVAIS
jgi:hypothetical protein